MPHTAGQFPSSAAPHRLKAPYAPPASMRRAGREVSPVPGLEPAPGPRSRSWEASVEGFAEELTRHPRLSEAWRRRMLYEVRRTPALLERVQSPSPLVRPDRFSVAQVQALRAGLPWSPGTLSLHFVALRRFLRWTGNPLANDPEVWSVPSGAPTHRRWLRPEDLARLYRASAGAERVLISL